MYNALRFIYNALRYIYIALHYIVFSALKSISVGGGDSFFPHCIQIFLSGRHSHSHRHSHRYRRLKAVVALQMLILKAV